MKGEKIKMSKNFEFSSFYERVKEEVKGKILELIDEIEKESWDCRDCGRVNSNVDTCPNLDCGDLKENSHDNHKLEELKRRIENG